MCIRDRYVISGGDLKNFGTPFREGSYLYETDVFREATPTTKKRVLDQHPEYKKIKIRDSEIPIIMRDLNPTPKEFGKFEYDGDIEVYQKNNISSNREYIFCKKKTVIKNKVLGSFELKKGGVYECFFETVGRNPTLKRNNIWIAQRNLKNIISKTHADYIEEIRNKI